MDASALRRGLPDATSRMVAATSRGPVARAAARTLVAGEEVGHARRATEEQLALGRTVSWMPLMKPAVAADDIITARDFAIATLSALGAMDVPDPDLTLDVGHFGVFADDVTAGLLVVSLREVCRSARNLGVSLTLTIADAAYIEAVYVLAEELRQDFPEVGIVLPTRLRTITADVEAQVQAGTRVRLNTGRLDPTIGTTSARESGRAFVDAGKLLLAGSAPVAFETDDVLLLDIAASMVAQSGAEKAEIVVPYGTPKSRIEEFEHPGLLTRVVIPFGTHPIGYITHLVAARPSLALSLPNPIRRRR